MGRMLSLCHGLWLSFGRRSVKMLDLAGLAVILQSFNSCDESAAVTAARQPTQVTRVTNSVWKWPGDAVYIKMGSSSISPVSMYLHLASSGKIFVWECSTL